MFRLRRYIKHARQCFIGYPNTTKFVKNTPLRVVFSTLFSVFGYPDETLSLLFDILHQTRKTVFDHISKHREESWKYHAYRSIFDELRRVWKSGQTLSWVFDTFSKSKLALRRKRRSKIVKIYVKWDEISKHRNDHEFLYVTWWIIHEVEKNKVKYLWYSCPMWKETGW